MSRVADMGDIDREERHLSPNKNSTRVDGTSFSSKVTASPATSPSSTVGDKLATREGDEDEVTVTKSLHVRRDWYSTIATFIAGGVAGAASRTLTAPLDRIKLIVQEGHLTQAPAGVKASADAAVNGTGTSVLRRTHPSLLHVARLIKADGGWKSFWRGNVINCFKAGPEFAIVFSIRRYVSSLYEDCVEREKRRRKRSILRWKEHDERCSAISRREEEERASMLGPVEDASAAQRTASGRRSAASGSSTTTDQLTDAGHLVAGPASAKPASSSASTSSTAPNWRYLTPQELREREKTISAEASIFTPPFNQLGCLSSIPQLVINCTIGAIAGLGAQGILYPLEVVKTRVVVSRTNEYRGGVREIVRLAYKKGGIREFYRGFAPNMVGIVVYRGLEMGLYSTAQQSIMLYRMQVLKKTRHDAILNAAEVGMVGMAVSTVAQTVSYPLNVIRTRLQTQGTNGRAKKYNGMVDCCVKMIRNKGVTSLFSGLTANYLKAVPASACTFVVFEWAQQLLVGDD